MHDTEVRVCFRPSGTETFVLPGTRLIEAMAEAGIFLDTPCGGEGVCGKCRVVVKAGAAEPTDVERSRLSDEELRAGVRLACQSTVSGPGPTHVEVLPDIAGHQIVVQAAVPARPANDPAVWKRCVELPPPSRVDDRSDLQRLEQSLAVGPLDVEPSFLREMPGVLRKSHFAGTAVVAGNRLLDFVPAADADAGVFAIAWDIGTTTLVGELLDLCTGASRGVASRLNPQTRFGDDVLSRIHYAGQNSGGLRQLQTSVIAALDEMIGELCGQAGVARHCIYEMTVAGNTTMQQLLCGVDVCPLGEAPFVPAFNRGVFLLAADLGLHIHPRGGVFVMPVIGGFVGGDTVAGLLAIVENFSSASLEKGPTLFIDVGTNGEIVLAVDGVIRAASTAAGPAFEGARISCGMRGAAGAIEKILVDDRLRLHVIGGRRPAGICGSGLIDVAAELLRHHILTPQGKLKMPDQLPQNVIPDLARRVLLQDGKPVFLLASEDETSDGRPLVLTQRDFRELQLAVGAMRAGVTILLRQSGLESSDLEHVLVGGGFGNFIRRSNAQRIGLLPPQVERHRIRYLGNTSLAGARLAAMSLASRRAAEELARRAEHVDLSANIAFSQMFAESMIFPESGDRDSAVPAS